MASYGTGGERDLYALFGVSSSAPLSEIRNAYHVIAKETHPDGQQGSPEAEARFKKVSQAYAILSNAEKRSEYDKAHAARAQHNIQRSTWGARPVKHTVSASFGTFQVAKPKNVARRPEHSGYTIPHAVNPQNNSHRPEGGARTKRSFKQPAFKSFQASSMGKRPTFKAPVFQVRAGNVF